MAVTLVIRSAGQADLPELVEIERESFPDPHWLPGTFLRYDCVLAEWEDRIAGFLVSRQTFAGEAGAPPEREILNVAVAAEFRRLGIGTALMRHELARKAQFFLEVRESNAAARALYRKLGFSEIGKRAGYYDNPRETAIVMQMKWC